MGCTYTHTRGQGSCCLLLRIHCSHFLDRKVKTCFREKRVYLSVQDPKEKVKQIYLSDLVFAVISLGRHSDGETGYVEKSTRPYTCFYRKNTDAADVEGKQTQQNYTKK